MQQFAFAAASRIQTWQFRVESIYGISRSNRLFVWFLAPCERVIITFGLHYRLSLFCSSTWIYGRSTDYVWYTDLSGQWFPPLCRRQFSVSEVDPICISEKMIAGNVIAGISQNPP
jgi:hypothetical protein